MSDDVRDVPPEGLGPSEIGWVVDRRIVGHRDEGADTASDWTRNVAFAYPVLLALAQEAEGERWSGLVRRGLVWAEAMAINGLGAGGVEDAAGNSDAGR